MRDRLRYRAWDKENKRYIYGVEKGLQFYSTAGNLRVMTLAEIEGSDKYDLEQCTGLKDKNGKLIYEGDILKSIYTEKTYIVDREKHYACWSYRYKNVGTTLSEGDIANYELEIVGNIHENPELLEEK